MKKRTILHRLHHLSYAHSQGNFYQCKYNDFIATDFIPIVGGAKDIYKGIRDGNGWQVALGVASIAFDVFTMGSGSIIKGAVKTAVKAAIRESAEAVIKQEAKQVIARSVVKTADGPMMHFSWGMGPRKPPSGIKKLTEAVEEGATSGGGLSNYDLVKKAGQKAYNAIPGKGPVVGTARHEYATKLLKEYQRRYGSRGLKFKEISPDGSAILDVMDNSVIYDWKTCADVPSQKAKYQLWWPSHKIEVFKYTKKQF